MKMDTDGSGQLDKEEFSQVMMVLFGNVMMRVLFQYAATLMVVPLLAQTLLNLLFVTSDLIMGGWLLPWIWNKVVVDPDTPTPVVDEVLMRYWNLMVGKVMEESPAFLLRAGNSVKDVFDMVPESVWNTVPLTLLSTLLSMMIIPWTLMKIDDYFQSLADQGGKQKQKQKNT
jgi:hypothetical protein